MTKNYKINLFILLLSILFLSSKWYFEFSHYPDEDITFKVIASAISDSYFHYIKIIDNFEFIRNFNLNNVTSDRLILIPLGSIIFHSIMYILFGSYALIICEFFFLLFSRSNAANSLPSGDRIIPGSQR